LTHSAARASQTVARAAHKSRANFERPHGTGGQGSVIRAAG
jgi:hypothetical protein